MVLLLVFMQLTRDLFAIAKFLFFTTYLQPSAFLTLTHVLLAIAILIVLTIAIHCTKCGC